MESTKDIVVGQLVKSKSGRDSQRLFLVLEILDDNYVLIVDGDLRRLDKPKKKKIKHLIVYHTVLDDLREKKNIGAKINNAYIRKLLEPFHIEEQ